MDPNEVLQFGQMLTYLFSGSEEERRLTQQKYDELVQNMPDHLVFLLCSLNRSESPELRKLSMAFLRRAFLRNTMNIWPKVKKETKDFVKEHLMNILFEIQDGEFINTVTELVSDLAVISGNSKDPADAWPNLFDELFKICRSNLSYHRGAGLSIFRALFSELPMVMEQYLIPAKKVIEQGLNDRELNVRIEALNATTGVINGTKKSKQREIFQSLLPDMLKVLQDSFSSKNTNDATKALESFFSWTKDPMFLNQRLHEVLGVFFKITLEAPHVEHKHSALEFLVAFTEKQPKKLVKVPNFLKLITDAILTLMLDYDSLTEEEWNILDDADIADEWDAYNIHQCLDNLALAVGTPLVQYLLPKIQILLSDNEWFHRAAALDALMLSCQGCKKGYRNNLDQILEWIMPQFQFNHCRVRWGALNVIAEFSYTYLEPFVSKNHQLFYETVIHCLLDHKNVKVQTCAAICVSCIVESGNLESILPHLDLVLQYLFKLLSSTEKNLLEEVVSAIGSISTKTMSYFLPYYPTFMSALSSLLVNCNSEKYYSLRNKIIETVSFIGTAVGKEVFQQDAHQYMLVLQETEWGEHGKNNSSHEVLLRAAVRVARILGPDFVQYLPKILTPIMETVAMDSSKLLSITDYDPLSKGFEEKDGWEYFVFANRCVGIMNSALEEKVEALKILYCLIESLEKNIVPYFNQILPVVIKLLEFGYLKSIRSTAARCITLLFYNYQQVISSEEENQRWLTLSWEAATAILKSIVEEGIYFVTTVKLKELANLIAFYPPYSLSQEQVNLLLSTLPNFVNDLEQVLLKRLAAREQGNYTDEDEFEWRELEKDEQTSITELANFYGLLSRAHTFCYQNVIVNYFEMLFQLFSHHSNIFHQLAMTIFADLIEHAPSVVTTHLDFLINKSLELVHSDLADLRSCSAYVFGTTAKRVPTALTPYISHSIEKLVEVIQDEDAMNDDYSDATECAKCSLIKVLYYHPEAHKFQNEYLITLLSWVPIQSDPEAATCHSQLCEMVSARFQLFTNSSENTSLLFVFFSWCFANKENTNLVPSELQYTILSIFERLQTANPQMVEYAIKMLNPVVEQCLIEGIKNVPNRK